MPFGPKWTAGILGHYSEAWAIAPWLRAEVCGRRGSELGAGGSQGKSWKLSGSRWETGKGSEGVREGQERSGRSGRSGRGPEGCGKVRKRQKGTGSNSMLQQLVITNLESFMIGLLNGKFFKNIFFFSN